MQIPPDQEEDEYEYEDDFFEETPSELANVSRIPAPLAPNQNRRSNASSVTEAPSVVSEPVSSRRYTKVGFFLHR